jgi:hypothetical protein
VRNLVFVFDNQSAIQHGGVSLRRRETPNIVCLMHGERTHLLTISRELCNAH